ncbi:MAG TPA: hypothetical protein VD994_20115 [Prosthecobacter sp.]|nr:hypothetical protein [Prosthecobacter sp.]
MPRVPPAILLLALVLIGVVVALLIPVGQPQNSPQAVPAAAVEVAAESPSAGAPPPGEDLRKQISLLEGQVEYLQGQVSTLQEENNQLIQKLGSLGMKGAPKMELPNPPEDPPDFVGMGLDMMKLRKLQALPIPTTGASQAEVEAAILRWLRQQQPDDEAPRFALALAALGWIEKPVDPLPLRAALLARQLGGWYDPEKATLLTVDESVQPGMPPLDKPMAIAFGQLLREFGSTLFPTGKGRLTTDQRLARESLLAGDAGLTRFLFGLQNPSAQSPLDLPSEDPDHPLNEVPMPLFLKELSLFPFNRGFEFAQSLHSAGEYAQVNAAYSRPPLNSSEVVEVERYLDNNPQPAPRIQWANTEVLGAKPFWDDSLGRFACFTALRTYNSDEDAGAGAKGWLADRLLAYAADSGPRDHAAWQTLWIAPDSAAAFFKAMRHVLLQRYDVKPSRDEEGHLLLEAAGRQVRLMKNRDNNGVLLLDAASAEFASALQSSLDGVPKPAP